MSVSHYAFLSPSMRSCLALTYVCVSQIALVSHLAVVSHNSCMCLTPCDHLSHLTLVSRTSHISSLVLLSRTLRSCLAPGFCLPHLSLVSRTTYSCFALALGSCSSHLFITPRAYVRYPHLRRLALSPFSHTSHSCLALRAFVLNLCCTSPLCLASISSHYVLV